MGMLLSRAVAGEERVVVDGLTGGTLKCDLGGRGGSSLPHRGQGVPTQGYAPSVLSSCPGEAGSPTAAQRRCSLGSLGRFTAKPLKKKQQKKIGKGKERNPIRNLSSAQDPRPRCCHLPPAFPRPPSPISGRRGTPVPGEGQVPVPTCAHCPALPPRAPQPPAAAPGPGGKQEALPSTVLRK